MISRSRLNSIIQPEHIKNEQMFTKTWGERTIKVKVYTFVEPDIMNIRDNVYIVSTLIEDNGKVVNRGYSYIINIPNVSSDPLYLIGNNNSGNIPEVPRASSKLIKTPVPTEGLIIAVASEHFFTPDSLRAVQRIRRIIY
jgi:hypothetical protein